MKYTPGPWEIFTIASPDGVSYRIFREATPPEDITHIPMDWSNEANARLIAAAPDLLETVQYARGLFESLAIIDPEQPKWPNLLHILAIGADEMQAAIDKATK